LRLLLVLVLLLLLLLLHLLLSCQQLLLHCQLLLLVRLDELLLTLHELIHLLPQLLVLSPDIQQCLLLRCKGLSGSRICRQPTGSPRVPVVRLRSCLWRWHRRLWLLLTLMLGCWWRWLWILLLALSLTLLSLFLETGTMSTLGDISEPVARLVTSEDRPIRAQPANASAVVTSEISARPTKPDAMVTPTPLLRTLPAEHELIVLLSHISPVARDRRHWNMPMRPVRQRFVSAPISSAHFAAEGVNPAKRSDGLMAKPFAGVGSTPVRPIPLVPQRTLLC